MNKQLEILIKQDLDGNKPKWCKHITFWSRAAGEETFLGIESFPQAGGWTFKHYKTSSSPLIADNWKFCPICGTPKPE
jgi:hypothetical protein